jgi:magnesium-protoporphyrin IX monomethyl ester (oxidative) cyclase
LQEALLRNVRLLRWCAEERVKVSWNVIYDIPGDREDTYDCMTAMLPDLHHLQPPNGCSRMSLDRFSPFFEQADRYGITDVRPLAPFRYLYPFDEATVMGIASAFDYETSSEARRDRSQWELRQAVATWRREWRPWGLTVVEAPSGGVRLTGGGRALELDALASALYRALEDIGSAADLSKRSPEAALAGPTEVEARLEALVSDRVVVKQGHEFLSLGLFCGKPDATS